MIFPKIFFVQIIGEREREALVCSCVFFGLNNQNYFF